MTSVPAARKKIILQVLLAYALCNLDEIGECFDHEGNGKMKVAGAGSEVPFITEEEINALMRENDAGLLLP